MHRRRAMTRVEVLVGMLIAVLVVGLFVAGMGRVRASADRVNCQNNLHSLGLAVANYDSTYNQLPPLVGNDGAPTGTALPSVFATLMAYLESDPWNYTSRRTPAEYNSHSSVVFTIEDRARGYTFTEHGGIANQSNRKLFLDPADDTAKDLRDVPMTLPDDTTGYYATGGYAANGLLPWGTGSLPKSFPRGTQNTILMGERPQVCRTAAGEVVHNLWGVGFYCPEMPAFACLTPAEPAGLASTGQIAPVEPVPEDGPVLVRIGRKDAAPVPADFPTPLQRVRDGRCDPRLPGGPHPSGMQVGMADGSVRVFNWDTSPHVFWLACTPDSPPAVPDAKQEP